MINVLSIGNSYSSDAHSYIHRIAKADGVELNTFNLYIGGCSLYMHYVNMLSEEKCYALEVNGTNTGFNVSLKEALLNRNWDIITLQQASFLSVNYNEYQPYLNELAAFVRRMVPKAKIAIHQTWAYEQGSEFLSNLGAYTDQKDMFNALKKAYDKAASDVNADFIIPSGMVFQSLLESGIEKVHRDGSHASLGCGRYALGLLWYKMITGNSIEKNNFSLFDEEITSSQVQIIKSCVDKI